MERDARQLERGVELSGRRRNAADAERAHAACRGARLLNPDTAPDVGRRVLYGGAGQRERAVACSRTCCGASPTT